MNPQTESEYLNIMVQNIRHRCEAIELEHAKLDAEKTIIQGYAQNFMRRLEVIKNKG
jgi:hypothetical protein